MHIPKDIRFDFPLPRPHAGIPLGNGNLGVMVWSGDDRLFITVARAGFWDRRGGNVVMDRATFRQVRELLEADDEPGMYKLFGRDRYGCHGDSAQGAIVPPTRPQQYGGARVEVRFKHGLAPRMATLSLSRGCCTIHLQPLDASHPSEPATLQLRLDPTEESFVLEDEHRAIESVRLIPAFEFCRLAMSRWGIVPPIEFSEGSTLGFIQHLPEDEPLGIALDHSDNLLRLVTRLGSRPNVSDQASPSDPALLQQLKSSLQRVEIKALHERADAWWNGYWQDIPEIVVPDETLQRAYDYGCYKQAGLSPAHAVAATLQGPWMEDYQPPPWSNDYHFNINVQLVYGPALPTGRYDHLKPLWAMLRSWMPTLRERGERFFQAPGAMILPHAVDDQCHVVGSFWSGTIDHACTAWVAQMAFRHYRFTLDEHILRELAWPLLNGAFEGYFAMLEEVDSPGGATRYRLPVSVSPEFHRDATMKGSWGRDASFQLAALHMTIRMLRETADRLGMPHDPRWADVSERSPAYATAETSPGRSVIAVWDGIALPCSHRHHSHLASIWPFCTVNPADTRHREIVLRSFYEWMRHGSGQWSGWCVPWASILASRLGFIDAAIAHLHWWEDVFTNEGFGPLHDSDFAGGTSLDAGHTQSGRGRFHPNLPGAEVRFDERALGREIMQCDAAMAAVVAVTEMFAQLRYDEEGREVIALLPAGLPKRWRDVSITDLRIEGAFRVSICVQDRQLTRLTILSEAGEPLCVQMPDGRMISRQTRRHEVIDLLKM